MGEMVRCGACGLLIDRQHSYVARIDIFADATCEPIDTGSSASAGDDAMKAVLSELEHMSADDAMDGVHRRFEFHLCRPCQRAMLANPLGLPRASARTWDGRN